MSATTDTRTCLLSESEQQVDLFRREVAECLRDAIGFKEPFASFIADELVNAFQRRMGGSELWVPAPNKADRNARIRAEYNGRNMTEICRKYGVRKSTVYNALRERPKRAGPG